MITTFSDHRCLAVNRYTATEPKQRNSRVNTQTAPKMVLKSITANGIKLHFYVRYTSYTYHKQDFQFIHLTQLYIYFLQPLHTVIIIMNWWRIVFNSSTFSKLISLNITGMDKFIVSPYSEFYKCRLGTVPVYIPCRYGVRVSFRCFVSHFV